MKFIESICFSKGDYQNLYLHQERVNKTFLEFFPESRPLQLDSILPRINSDHPCKVRVVYEEEGQDVSFSEYKKRIIETLEVVESSPFNYSHKFENRANISLLAESSNADDIIIAFNGEVKDSSYANLAFWNGQEWLTPENPLLEGVRRARLLQEKKIKKATIHISDLGAFEKVSLINAMLDLGDIEIDLK